MTGRRVRAASSRGLLPYQAVLALASASIAGVTALLGTLRDDLGAGNVEAGLLVAAGFVAAFVAQVTLAPLADRGHGARLVQVGLLLGSLALVSMAVLDDVWGFVAARAVLGFGLGMMIPGVRRVGAVLDPDHVGENLGKLIAGEVAGYVVGPVLTAGLAELGGLSFSFAALGVWLALFLPFAWLLPPDPGRREHHARTSFDLLRLPALTGALILAGGYVIVIAAAEVVLPLQLTDAGHELWQIGVVFTVLALPIVAAGPIAGRVADRVGALRVAVVGMIVATLAATLLGVVDGLAVLLCLVVVFGVADGFGYTAGQALVSRSVPEERQAGALGLMGATEVLVAGLVVVPAAAVYSEAGKEVVWVAAAAGTLAVVGIGSWLVVRSPRPSSTRKGAGRIDA